MPELTLSQRAQLGLLDGDLVEEERVPIVTDEAAQGKGAVVALTLATLAAQGAGAASYSRFPSKPGSAVGVRTSLCDQNHSIVLVEGPKGQVLFARQAALGEEPIHPDGNSACVLADLSKGLVVVQVAEGRRVGISREGREIVVHGVKNRPFGTEQLSRQLSDMRPPLQEWIAQCEDRWVARELSSRATSPDPWKQIAAAGLHARLQEAGWKSRSIVLQRALEGIPDVNLLAARTWAKTLQRELIDSLQRAALSRVDALFRTIDELDLEMNPTGDAWMKKLHDACINRDDVESVRLLLSEAKEATAVDEALAALDHRAREFIDTLPCVVSIEDEQLRRAGLGDPNAWWATIALASA